MSKMHLALVATLRRKCSSSFIRVKTAEHYNMSFYILSLAILLSTCVNAQFGNFKQNFGYVNVREGAHMFYWLFYTTASVTNYTERPLIVWLQGGPGGSSTGVGNFEILGPLDLSLQERNYTWVNNFNVLFVDNPVGTGFSYVEDLKHLTKTNDEIALDFVELMKGFYRSNPEFEGVPLYIFGQSYGGKMAIDMGIRMREAEKAGTIKSNLLGIAMGNAWIHPVDATLTWGPLLLAAGLVDQEGYEDIQASAREAERLFNEGFYWNSTLQWARTQQVVFRRTTRVDFYNILTKMEVFLPDSLSAYEIAREAMIRDMPTSTRQQLNLTTLMNTEVKAALRIPEEVEWGSQSSDVFDTLQTDFMKPVTEGIEKLLNETNIILMKYNGNLDLICDTPGQLLWVDRLKWSGAEEFRNTERRPIWENDKLEGYYKSFGNFRFFWINVAGHSVPRDNPAGANAFLRDMTSFG
ncbi:jg13914 [Pararge aegeria aegeria]|uniref:Retinoid-inducible serine carboxypeptidase n=1 Tax=Pararge aegeria aegeria TaxID=348720 RepID=A0A8S4SG20_9NEOP|nr:jg13914 [Pararge aegeria aegeria]